MPFVLVAYCCVTNPPECSSFKHHTSFHGFCGSGSQPWLGWVLGAKALTGCHQAVSQGHSLVWRLTHGRVLLQAPHKVAEGFTGQGSWFLPGPLPGGPRHKAAHSMAACSGPSRQARHMTRWKPHPTHESSILQSLLLRPILQ